MRSPEWIQVVFALILSAAAWIRPLPARRRLDVTLFAVFAVCAAAGASYGAKFLTPGQAAVLWDWFPLALIFVPYWQTGRFFLGPNREFQNALVMQDRRWLRRLSPITRHLGPRFRFFFEIAYLSCYALVPLGLGLLTIAGQSRYADAYWVVVLVSTYICYAITPFFPALPPRTVENEQAIAVTPNSGRAINHWLLKRGSIQAISFPSAHVASTLALSLMLLKVLPVTGSIVLAWSVSIAVAAVVGRYHYALDVVLGAAVAVVVYLAWLYLSPNSFMAAPAMALMAGL